MFLVYVQMNTPLSGVAKVRPGVTPQVGHRWDERSIRSYSTKANIYESVSVLSSDGNRSRLPKSGTYIFTIHIYQSGEKMPYKDKHIDIMCQRNFAADNRYIKRFTLLYGNKYIKGY